MDTFLVYNFSGDVDEVSHLFPSERLARVAGSLDATGGRVEVIDRANFADILSLGAGFMAELAGLSFHDTSPAYESALDLEAVAVLDRSPECVFLNLWHGTGFKFSMDLAARLKHRAPKVRLYGIGQKVDEFKEHVFRFAGGHLDGLVAGLGYDAVADIATGRPRETIPNLIYEADGVPLTTARRPLNVDDHGEPLYDESTYRNIGRKVPIYSLSLSNQSCPCRCAFCIRPEVYGRTVRKRSIPAVVREIEKLHARTGVNHFRVEDSTPPRHALTELAKGILDSDIAGKVTLSAFARVDINGVEDFALLRKAGFVSLFFGVESLDDSTLKLLNKRTTRAVIERTLRLAHDAGILTVGSFIFPTPGTTRESMENTLAGIADLRPWLDSVLVLPAGVLPHTDWMRNMERYGIALSENYLDEGVIYPIKYLVPMRLWKPFPFSYRLMGREARDVTFEDIVAIQAEFVERVRKDIGIPGIPDYYYLIADLVGRPASATAQSIVEAMTVRDYAGLAAVFGQK